MTTSDGARTLGAVSKATRLSVRLDARDRQRLEMLVEHFALSPSAVVRMLLKERSDEVARRVKR